MPLKKETKLWPLMEGLRQAIAADRLAAFAAGVTKDVREPGTDAESAQGS